MQSELFSHSDSTAEFSRSSRPSVHVRTQALDSALCMRKELNCSHIEPVEALNIWKFLWNVRACLYLVLDRNRDHRWIFYPSFMTAVKRVPQPINPKVPGHMSVVFPCVRENTAVTL